jgi:uncharacterized protein YjbJ (UPF0337 family)
MAAKKNSPPPEQVKGSVKEAIGKLTGDVRVEAEGRHQKRDAREPNESTSKTSGSPRD